MHTHTHTDADTKLRVLADSVFSKDILVLTKCHITTNTDITVVKSPVVLLVNTLTSNRARNSKTNEIPAG